LQADLKKIEATGTTVIAVSYDTIDVLNKFTEKRKIAFPLLSDPDSKVITSYDLFNKEAKGKTEGIPYPGTFLIDQDGVIHAKLFIEGYRERHTVADLVKAAEELKKK
jgi:peroxiredoxin Q/BCP